MYSRWQLAIKYLKYQLSASNGKGHGIHSPFIFHFITRILNDKEQYPAFKKVESLRRHLVRDNTNIIVEDMGAGGARSKTKSRTVASIAAGSAKPAKFGQLMYRIIKAYQPGIRLELGTSLGLTTSYLALANEKGSVITIEGAPAVAAIARSNFSGLGISNVSSLTGNFDQLLPGVLTTLKGVDFVFIDGNHRREPTERYFLQLLEKTQPDSILIFDDIHWSKEMEQAWATVKSHPRVRCTVDLFYIGLVFFREEFREKQDFIIRF